MYTVEKESTQTKRLVELCFSKMNKSYINIRPHSADKKPICARTDRVTQIFMSKLWRAGRELNACSLTL